MIETAAYILACLSFLVLIACLIGAHIIWRSNRALDQAVAKMAKEAGE